jgi:Tfp pilus assembly protein PilF
MDAALEQYKSALRIHPYYGEVYGNCAKVLARQGKINEGDEEAKGI